MFYQTSFCVQPLHGPGPGGVPGPDGEMVDREAPVTTDRRIMGVHLGGVKRGGGI